ncbi:MAG: CARDB domain-containing protein [Nocardioidaceae bacterium]
MADFIGITKDTHGRILVGYADGCAGTCVTSHVKNLDAYATIARQRSGMALFAQYDPKPNPTPLSITYTKASTGGVVLHAPVTNNGTAAAKSVQAASFVNGRRVATSSAVDIGAGVTKTLNASWLNSVHGAAKLAVVVDPAETVSESNEGDNRYSKPVTIP